MSEIDYSVITPVIIPECINCGIKTLSFLVLVSGSAGATDTGYPTFGGRRWRLFACPQCHQVYIHPTLIKECREDTPRHNRPSI